MMPDMPMGGGMPPARKGKSKKKAKKAVKGFRNILNAKVKQIQARGGRTAGGKKIRNPMAYVGAGLRRTGMKKYGKRGFAARQKRGLKYRGR